MTNSPTQEQPTTVLVVDDEDGIRQALDRFLSRLGYRVLQASSGAEALDRQAAEQPQVMLSDIRMPNMSGVELVPKALAADSDLAIIMLTAIDEPRTAIECLKLGAYDYLIKPVDLDELELSLQGALRQRQLEVDRRELEQWLARGAAGGRRGAEAREGARDLGGRRAAGDPQAAWRELSLLRRLRLLLTRLAARDPTKRADETDEGPAVRAGIALRRAFLVAAVAAYHRIVLHQFRFVGHGRLRGRARTP